MVHPARRHRAQSLDGALVRVVTPIRQGESETAADRRLTDFLDVVQPRLSTYLPR